MYSPNENTMAVAKCRTSSGEKWVGSLSRFWFIKVKRPLNQIEP